VKKYFIPLIIIFCVFFSSEIGYAQLGFCNGNSGDPIFTETFGTGVTNNALPAGTTNYTYTAGAPQDGFYTVSNTTGYFDWYATSDHTNDVNGKCLILPPAGCGGNGIPVNVKFEIWDNTNTNILASGDTGNIGESSTPNWQQYGWWLW